MKLLGRYNSNLILFHAEELLKVLEQVGQPWRVRPSCGMCVSTVRAVRAVRRRATEAILTNPLRPARKVFRKCREVRERRGEAARAQCMAFTRGCGRSRIFSASVCTR